MMKPAFKLAILAPAAFIAVLISAPAAADEAFAPWGADVRVGDENIAPARAASDRITPVYNGAQGAGWFFIRFFQVVVSPQDGPNCRYHPTCSAYGRRAVERFGLARGLFLAGDRVLRCNPYNPPTDDPVPADFLGK
jgi:uncharacterized protein